MKISTHVLLLGTLLLTPEAFAQAAPVPATDADDCPPGKPIQQPRLPPEVMMKDDIKASVLLDVGIDTCGRVTDVTVKKSSKQAGFDEAAVDAIKDATLTPEQRKRASNGRVLVPFDFSFGPVTGTAARPFSGRIRKVDWPRTHRRPHYVLEPAPPEYTTADMASQAIKSRPNEHWQMPYSVMGRFVPVGEPDKRDEYWLFIAKGLAPNVAARYRPTMENGEPIVRLAIICDDTPGACDKTRDFLLKGLPYAKAKKMRNP